MSIACADTTRSPDDRPNIVIVFADDLGYGDIGSYGHPTIRTPNIDRLAAEGQRWTQFYAAAPVCTPSRAALMTGRLPIRNGMTGPRGVLFPDSLLGLPEGEFTLAEALRDRGYATGIVGKWHLGHRPAFLPTAHGFDSYFGIPYSNDMDRDANAAPAGRAAFDDPKSEYWNVPLMRDTDIIERPADQTTLTRRYTEAATAYIRAHSDRPFFLYLAHAMPHVPLFRSDEFAGRSLRGLYGDVIEELDWSVGQIAETLRAEGLERNTLLVFTSDNGPWLSYDVQGGSAGLLRAGKGTTWEGGVRVPFVASWPGRIAPGVVTDLGTTMDVYATAVALAGGTVRGDRVLDGLDIQATLFGQARSPRDTVLYYRERELYAIRQGRWKAHFISQGAYGQFGNRIVHDTPELYDLDIDPSETTDVAAAHPDVIERLRDAAADHLATVEPSPSRLEARLSDDVLYTGPAFRRGRLTAVARTHAVAADLSGLPALARQSVAIMEIQLDREGGVVSARMLRGVRADIDERALAAVRQWRHEPMRLAEPVHAPDGTTWPVGTAVPVFMNVTMIIPPHQPQ